MTKILSTHVDSYVFHRKKKEPEYLLLRRREGKFYGHLWQGVAGKIETGETAVETVLRELKEETRLTPVQIFLVDHVSSFYQCHKDQINMIPVFGIEVDSSEVLLSDEHSEYRWLKFSEAAVLLSWRQQKKALSVLHEMIMNKDERMKWSEVDLQ